MRLALVCPFDPFPPFHDSERAHMGGVERVYAELSRHLARRGHDVTVVCSTPAPSGEGRVGGVRVLRAHRDITIMRTPLVSLARLIPRDSDIVQVAGTYPFTTAPVIRWAKRARKRVLLDFHFEPAPATPFGRAAAWAFRRLAAREFRKADAVLVRTQEYARSAPSLAGVPEQRWRIVANGYDAQRFRPLESARVGEYLLFVGRLVPYKGLDVLFQALAYLRPGLPLLVVGNGPMRARWVQEAKRLDVDTRFQGHVPDNELPALYRGARLTVLPSVTRQEAFGLTLLESMGCGTPVVASDLPGVAEIARLGGLVARPRDAEDLAVQIQRALQADRLARGVALSTRVRTLYAWEAVVERLESVYHDLLEGRLEAEPTPWEKEVTAPADPGRHTLL